MSWRKAALKQQAHRIALISERRLDTDKNVAEPFAKHKQRRSICLHPTWRNTPLRLYFVKPTLLPHMLVSRYPSGYICIGTKQCSIAT